MMASMVVSATSSASHMSAAIITALVIIGGLNIDALVHYEVAF